LGGGQLGARGARVAGGRARDRKDRKDENAPRPLIVSFVSFVSGGCGLSEQHLPPVRDASLANAPRSTWAPGLGWCSPYAEQRAPVREGAHVDAGPSSAPAGVGCFAREPPSAQSAISAESTRGPWFCVFCVFCGGGSVS